MRKFVAGLVIGVALALMYAPERGDETRERLRDKVKRYWDEAQA